MKLYTKFESGRSMVEMLGVLAVIGVLSIGGITGYSYGMDKYRANETINQIMLRAIDLMTQASNNNAELSLAGWSNETSQYDFANEDYTEDGLIAFDMGINNPLPKSVCEMVYDGMSSMAEQIDINGARAESNDACTEENEMTFYFEGQIGTRCIPECAENEYCYNGICFKGGVPEGTRGYKECSSNDECGQCGSCYSYSGICWAENYRNCTVDGKDGLCRSGECYPIGACTTNDDCQVPGTYCASTNKSSTERFPGGEMGSCVPLDFVRKEFGGETYYISKGFLSWWDAEYACDAIGSKKMLNVSDLVEESSWNGGNDSDIVFTPLGQEISMYWNGHIWTQTPTNDPERMFTILTSSFIQQGYRGYGSLYLAVCH